MLMDALIGAKGGRWAGLRTVERYKAEELGLGPRLPGPGFNVRWRRVLSSDLGGITHWVESRNPNQETRRSLGMRRPADIARELVECDRNITLIAASKVRRNKGRRARIAAMPELYRVVMASITRNKAKRRA